MIKIGPLNPSLFPHPSRTDSGCVTTDAHLTSANVLTAAYYNQQGFSVAMAVIESAVAGGTATADLVVEVSNNQIHFIPLITLNLSAALGVQGVAGAALPQVAWPCVRCRLTNITGQPVVQAWVTPIHPGM